MEYLAVLDDAAFGAATPVVPKYLAPADPASRWTSAHRGSAFYAYSTNYLIDLYYAVIMDVEASTAVRQADVTAAKRMIARVQDRFGGWPERLAADTAYGSAEMLAWLVHERGIQPHISVFDKSARRDGTFERDAFTYDHDDDSYVCPGGKCLRPKNRNYATTRGDIGHDGFIRYRRDSRTAAAAPYENAARPTCRRARSPVRSTKGLATLPATSPPPTPTSLRAVSERRSRRSSRTSPHTEARPVAPARSNGARDESHMAATAQYLRKMAKLIPMPAHPLSA